MPDPAIAARWLRQRSEVPLFNGGAPLDQLLGGQVGDLYVARQYLDAQCTASP